MKFILKSVYSLSREPECFKYKTLAFGSIERLSYNPPYKGYC